MEMIRKLKNFLGCKAENDQNKQSSLEKTPNVINQLCLDILRLIGQTVLQSSPLERAKRVMNRLGYDIVKEIGQGGFGTVYEVIKTSGCEKGQTFAVKRVRRSKESSVSRERSVYKMLRSSSFIPKFYHEFSTKEDVYLFFELLTGGDLMDLFDTKVRMGEDEIKPYFREIAQGINELHKKKIVHRDIKLDNIVLNESGKPYIIDFGSAKIFQGNEDSCSEDPYGTIAYLSPEMILGEYSYETDWWSFGVCVFYLLVGKEPFADIIDSDETIERRIVEDEVPWSNFDFLSDNAKDFLKRLLCKNPKERLGANGVTEILSHPFMTS